MTPTLQICWQLYRDSTYPDGTTATQNKETHQAFVAGALQMFVLMNAAAALPEDQAMKAMSDMEADLKSMGTHAFTTTHPPDLGGS